jgi:D-glycero-D-manno-heptose 1,7-bisphosphate phosphatase
MSASQRTPLLASARFVFLDRDGVINRKRPEGEWVTRWEEVELLPGAAAAIAALNRTGCTVIMVTNQRGVALGLMTEAELRAIHERLRSELAALGARLDAIYFCPHDRGECRCRKPQTGMIEAAWQDFPGSGPGNSVLIGDSLSDIECGRNAGMPTIFVEGSRETEARTGDAALARMLADAVAASLADAVQFHSG